MNTQTNLATVTAEDSQETTNQRRRGSGGLQAQRLSPLPIYLLLSTSLLTSAHRLQQLGTAFRLTNSEWLRGRSPENTANSAKSAMTSRASSKKSQPAKEE